MDRASELVKLQHTRSHRGVHGVADEATNWRHEANGRRVHGRGAWFSTDLVVLALRDGALVGAPRLIAPSAAPGGGPTLVEGYKKSRARTRRRLAQQWLPSAR